MHHTAQTVQYNFFPAHAPSEHMSVGKERQVLKVIVVLPSLDYTQEFVVHNAKECFLALWPGMRQDFTDCFDVSAFFGVMHIAPITGEHFEEIAENFPGGKNEFQWRNYTTRYSEYEYTHGRSRDEVQKKICFYQFCCDKENPTLFVIPTGTASYPASCLTESIFPNRRLRLDASGCGFALYLIPSTTLITRRNSI